MGFDFSPTEKSIERVAFPPIPCNHLTLTTHAQGSLERQTGRDWEEILNVHPIGIKKTF